MPPALCLYAVQAMQPAPACAEKVYRQRHPERSVFYSVLFHPPGRRTVSWVNMICGSKGNTASGVQVIEGVVEKYFYHAFSMDSSKRQAFDGGPNAPDKSTSTAET